MNPTISRRIDEVTGSKTGLASLVRVAQMLGITSSVEQLIRDNGIQDHSISSREIIRSAAGLGLVGKETKCSVRELHFIDNVLPAILCLRNGEFFVLTHIDRGSDKSVFYFDDTLNPSGPSILLDALDLERVWDNKVILFKRNYDLKDEQQPFGLGLIKAIIFKERRVVVDVVISAIILSVLALVPIIFWRLMSDRVLQYHAWSTFWVLCAMFLVFLSFEVAFSALRRYMLVGLTARIDIRLSTYMFDKVLNLPVDYFERTPTGFTLHQMGQLGRIRSFLLGQLFGTVLDAGILLIFFPVMFLFSPILTSVVLALCALMIVIILSALPSLRRRGGAVESAEADRGAMLAQTIHGIRTVKSLSLERRQRHQWDVLTARVARARMAEGCFANWITSSIMPLERLVVSGSLAIGVYLALESSEPLAVGTLFAFLMLSQRVAAPLIQASQLLQQYDEARMATAVVASLVNQVPEEGRSGNGVMRPIVGHVEFQNVVFSYKGALKPALRELSFEVTTGTTLGVMGRSGSGKTTITRLLQRLHSDYSGLIKIDGVDVRQYDIDFLRSSLGVVLQENFLFSGTIRENITIAKPSASYEEMVMAARMAGAEEFIEKLPSGYETYIYEGSPNLSGGQRQRLAIARALITDPKILILDEATSALDAESEAIVNANIDRIAQGRTVITISHRLASLVKCDAIMVLDGGVIDDIGRHEELVERNDIYAHLWYTQNQHAGGPPPGPVRRTQPKLAYRGPN